MDAVTSATSTQSTAAATGAKANVDYNSFLKLLVAELKNQDPTKPMDSTEYVAQLATFSNVEQGIQTNSKLDDLISLGHLQQAGSIIGRTLTTADKSVTGSIHEVRVFDDGIIAVLDSGEQVKVTSGVTISE
jgi:flagellar basal-body rod modification protein FlgD